jgi:regulator of extracellular matrix RemA (YlzA/DUF370 family)
MRKNKRGTLLVLSGPSGAGKSTVIHQLMEDRGNLIDATYGRRTRAVIIMDNNHVILSAIQPETVANRLGGRVEEEGVLENEEE